MKTGIELISEERNEQLFKHKRSIKDDSLFNSEGQLIHCASLLLQKAEGSPFDDGCNGLDQCFRNIIPKNWNEEYYKKMYDKEYKERLIIAGALIAAELDRIQWSSHI